jgi:hypothetical protein
LAPGLLYAGFDMDVMRPGFFSLLILFSISSQAWAEIEYISPEQQQKIENQFKEASFNAEKDLKKIENHAWSCDMFGARSHMQAQHGLKLYDLSSKAASGGGSWHNSGAQLVSEYKSEAAALIGRKDRFEDQVKLTKDGLLVSRLSLTNGSGTVVAYSVCKTL